VLLDFIDDALSYISKRLLIFIIHLKL